MIRLTMRAVACAALLLACGTQPLWAAGIGFKNNLPQPVIVQGATVVGNMLHRGPPLLLFPSRLTWDSRLDPGIRIITVYDANQPTRILHRQPIEFLGQDMLFLIQFDLNSQVSLHQVR